MRPVRFAECHPDRKHRALGLCKSCYQNEWFRKSGAGRDKPSNETRYNAHIKRVYGITREQYDAQLEAQGGVCALCFKPCGSRARLSIDHDHETGKFRGLLCFNCNTAIGKFNDDPSLVERAVEYLWKGGVVR